MSNAKYPKPGLHADRERLCNPYAHIEELEEASACEEYAESTTVRLLRNPYATEQVVDGYQINDSTYHRDALRYQRRLSGDSDRLEQIRAIVRNLHADLWRSRHAIFPDGVPDDPVALLDPSITLARQGYRYGLDEYLGDYEPGSKKGDVAGEIDRNGKTVRVCRRLKPSVRRFTAAHELGHAMLHQGAVMHRDGAIEGPAGDRPHRSPIEKEADVFAAEFLMPPNIVRERFRTSFGCSERFELTWDSAYALNPAKAEELMQEASRGRPLALVLATTGRYGGTVFQPLAIQFGVSGEAMAYRLLELGLVER